MVVEFFLLVVFLVFLIWKLCSKPHKYPPGPPRWPMIGNILELNYSGELVHESSSRLARRFGEVTGIFLGSQPVVIISSLDGIKEASAREDLSGRPIVNIERDINLGLIFSHGDLWREQRRFALRHLRDLGLGKRSMEGIIHEEVLTLLSEISRKAGPTWTEPVELHEVLGTSGINVLWHIIAGQRYSHCDERLRRLIDMVKVMTSNSSAAGGASSSFPWFARYFPYLTNLRRFQEMRKKMNAFVMEDITQHKETLDSENPRDFLDMYLIEMSKQSANSDTTFTEKQLLAVCRNLFAAGTDTTFNSVTFALVYMVRFPEIQEKVQEEIDRVVGRDRLPCLEDRANLIYVEATLQEALRLSSVVPLSVPHAPLLARKDVSFRGYVIPKNARVLLNLAYVHTDPKIWGDPEVFRPERFISTEGNLLKSDALIPFGSGKRQCLGESLARNNLLLFFAAVMQRYSLLVPPGEKPPSLNAVGGFTLYPRPFKALVKPRYISDDL